ncbi:hypothetical protein RHMOL_Rhmol13G0018900 [Rhododendron molle]|uniref:Uncharacterized protein n=1 Tax=Rhododendron molle TaxID=49168 RepID=A0ACC0L2Q5_RHOML|nr:hypothetical protein RHMOL_Rhmol13G0018900 [Rhododendron molle]
MSTNGDSIVNDDDDLNPDHEDHIHDQEEVSHQQRQLEAKKISSQKLRRFDSLDIESSKFCSHQNLGAKICQIWMGEKKH